MKHLLVAMDLSPLSDRAFERALQLAEAHEARLTLVHVIDHQVLSYEDQNSDIKSLLISSAESKLKRHWAAMSQSVAKRFHQIIRIGSPWETVLDVADEAGCDLVVLGLHHVHPLKDMFIGTTAERIIRNTALPVLVVKDKPMGPYRQVIVGTDFSPCSSRALQAVLALVPEADFLLFHAFEMPFPAFIHFGPEELEAWKQERVEKAVAQTQLDLEQFLTSHIASAAPQIRTLVERGEVGSVVTAIWKERQPDLMAFGTYGGSGVPGGLMGSLPVSFLNDPPCDVLVSR
jgi:nucleotide-binding universal stress UspA family protein